MYCLQVAKVTAGVPVARAAPPFVPALGAGRMSLSESCPIYHVKAPASWVALMLLGRHAYMACVPVIYVVLPANLSTNVQGIAAGMISNSGRHSRRTGPRQVVSKHEIGSVTVAAQVLTSSRVSVPLCS